MVCSNGSVHIASGEARRIILLLVRADVTCHVSDGKTKRNLS